MSEIIRLYTGKNIVCVFADVDGTKFGKNICSSTLVSLLTVCFYYTDMYIYPFLENPCVSGNPARRAVAPIIRQFAWSIIPSASDKSFLMCLAKGLCMRVVPLSLSRVSARRQFVFNDFFFSQKM